MILCCGEALIDMLPRTTDAGEDAFAPYAGGAVFNTAVALGRLGAPVGFFSGLSTDLFGEMLAGTLRASNVDTGPAHLSDRPTTLAFVKLADGHATYSFYDENTAGRMLTNDDVPDLGSQTGALFFGGISLVVEPCGTTYEALQMRESKTRVTMIDPNIRPSFVSDEAAYRARIARMIAAADIVKVSDEDLRWLEGEGGLDDLAQRILSRGPRVVFVTEGSDGASAHTETHKVFVAAPSIIVADTVGAGDTFNAGVLAALHRAGALAKDTIADVPGPALRDSLELGVKAAAITVSRPGADAPWADEI